jgi:hypothetical protein
MFYSRYYYSILYCTSVNTNSDSAIILATSVASPVSYFRIQHDDDDDGRYEQYSR